MNQADSSKVSRDEVHHPPRCCCSKRLKSNFPDLLIIGMHLFQAANAWDAKKTFIAKNEVEALSCKNGKDDLADGQEVSKMILANEKQLEIYIFDPQVTIETPNYPGNYPDKAKCNWKIKVPAGEEVHVWCETFDVVKGDFLRVSIKNFGGTILIL